jgi:hypothetical protein
MTGLPVGLYALVYERSYYFSTGCPLLKSANGPILVNWLVSILLSLPMVLLQVLAGLYTIVY